MPFSYSPTFRARQRCVTWVDIHNFKSLSSSFVFYKCLQLSPGPAMQTCAQALAPSNPFSNVSELLKNNHPSSHFKSLFDNVFTDAVIRLFDSLPLLAGDSFKASLRSLRTVGLKTATTIKKHISSVPKFSSSVNCATRRRSHVIFSQINSKDITFCFKGHILKIKNDFKKTPLLLSDQFPLFDLASDQVFSLMLAYLIGTLYSFVHCEKGEGVFLKRKGACTVSDTRCLFKNNLRNFLVLFYSKSLVTCAYLANGITHHLRTKLRQSFSNFRITQVMQGDLIPTSVFLSKSSYYITPLSKRRLCGTKVFNLVFVKCKIETNNSLHGKHEEKNFISKQLKKEQHFLPSLKKGVSALSIG